MALNRFSPKQKADSGIEFAVLNPGTGTPIFVDECGTRSRVYITVHGSDSKVCKAIQRRQSNHRLELAAKSRNRRAKVTAEQLEAEAMELMVGCTKAWRTEILDESDKVIEQKPGKIELNEGEWLDCTPENVQTVFEELSWMMEQADDKVGERSDFLPS